MSQKREVTELWNEINKDIYRIDEEKLYQYVKFAIHNLYFSILKDKEINIKCSEGLKEKLEKNNEYYRIVPDVDEINVQYVRLCDYVKNDNGKFIKIYASMYFYDNMANNIDSYDCKHYYNDIWILTFKCMDEVIKKNVDLQCENCGANMIYDRLNDVYRCEYCTNINKYIGIESELELVNIELEK